MAVLEVGISLDRRMGRILGLTLVLQGVALMAGLRMASAEEIPSAIPPISTPLAAANEAALVPSLRPPTTATHGWAPAGKRSTARIESVGEHASERRPEPQAPLTQSLSQGERGEVAVTKPPEVLSAELVESLDESKTSTLPVIQAVSRVEHSAQAIPTAPVATASPAAPGDEDLPILQVGCASCGSGPAGGGSFAGPDLYGALGSMGGGMVGDDPLGNCDDSMCVAVDPNGCCAVNCYPLREKCYGYCDDGNLFHRFIGLAYEVICCPDPFYELSGPHWVPAANAAFFTENAQPRSMTRLRWDAGQNMNLPDRNNFFFAQANGTGLGPNPLEGQANNPGQIPTGITNVNYDDLVMYVETATKNGKFSAFVTTRYRSVDPDVVFRHAGFGDMEVGTKSLLFDRELIQIAFQTKTSLPTGISFNGTGNGIVSLEPSVLFNVKLDEGLYWQSQVAQWIPFGALYGGGILMLNNSINKVIWKLNPDVSLIAVGEFSAWAFQGGFYTDPATLIPQSSSGGRYYNIAPGLRLCFRNFIDFGFSTSFAMTGDHFADQLYRLEGRLMY